ncbi:helix-turn-helix domain-containing protein, partial [Streptomyces goshikiensis]|uniref:helix-turn-helix domain-containing protein n=1 Tax=Streptomyces goshikiensis TaxID=1942 RepID=UPI0036C06678
AADPPARGPRPAPPPPLLRAAPEGLTAAGAAEAAGISRITARRYLEHLVDTGRADRTPRYGQVGRPELHYRWLAAAGSVSKV